MKRGSVALEILRSRFVQLSVRRGANLVVTPTGILLELVFREGNAASNSQRSDRHV